MLAVFFDLGSDFATSTLSLAGDVFSDFSGYILLMVGVIIALAFISYITGGHR